MVWITVDGNYKNKLSVFYGNYSRIQKIHTCQNMKMKHLLPKQKIHDIQWGVNSTQPDVVLFLFATLPYVVADLLKYPS